MNELKIVVFLLISEALISYAKMRPKEECVADCEEYVKKFLLQGTRFDVYKGCVCDSTLFVRSRKR